MSVPRDRRRRYPAMPLVASLLVSLSAVETRAAEPLTVDRAVALALARAPELRAARHGHTAARQGARQALSAYLPRVGLSASYLARWPKNELPIDLPDLPGMPQIGAIDDVHHARGGLEVGLRLLDLSRGPRREAAEAVARAAEAGIAETETQLAFGVRVAFLAALFARDSKRIAADGLRLALAQERRQRLRSEVGTGSSVALAQARVHVARLRAQLRKAESEHARYRAQLASLLGARRLPELRGDLAQLARPVPRRGLQDHPLLRRLTASAEAARLKARAAARTFIPTLDLFAKAEVEYPHVMRLEWGPLLSGGASLSWSIYDGGVSGATTKQAEARAAQASASRRAASDKLQRALIDLTARARTAGAELASARETLTQTEIYLRVARAARDAGTGTDLDVHQAELGVDSTRVAVQRALLSLALIQAETLMVRGQSQANGGNGDRS